MRVGFGYDVHALAPDRPLILGGVRIDYTHGLVGHSDADVLLHAICDALIGAASLGDIGRHFPESDPAYAGISSLILLRRSAELINQKGYYIKNIDATVIAERPRLAPYIPKMIEAISKAIGLPIQSINIKATTTEGLGFAGRGEGIAAYAVALLEEY